MSHTISLATKMLILFQVQHDEASSQNGVAVHVQKLYMPGCANSKVKNRPI
ncbi:MAG: hypothetical protein RB191_14700 [Terriglobia bacterium]|nr:hypothetical protein [Terriglobia bacterium]